MGEEKEWGAYVIRNTHSEEPADKTRVVLYINGRGDVNGRVPSFSPPSVSSLSLFSRGCAAGRYICGITVGIPFSGRA